MSKIRRSRGQLFERGDLDGRSANGFDRLAMDRQPVTSFRCADHQSSELDIGWRIDGRFNGRSDLLHDVVVWVGLPEPIQIRKCIEAGSRGFQENLCQIAHPIVVVAFSLESHQIRIAMDLPRELPVQ